jgi:plasmid replication initiation protein
VVSFTLAVPLGALQRSIVHPASLERSPTHELLDRPENMSQHCADDSQRRACAVTVPMQTPIGAEREPHGHVPDPTVAGYEIEPVGTTASTRIPLATVQTDSPLESAINGQADLMAYPFFSLSKTPSKRPIKFVEGSISVEVRPSDRGAATIYDKEILIYLGSLAFERLERGESFDGVLTFTAYDFFKLAGLSGASGKNYQRLAGALDRLQGTQVRTTIETGGINIDGWFSWISEAQIIFSRDSKGQKRARAFRVRITDWLVRAIVADGSMLTYDPSYFELSAIERRIYEIARAGCGRGGTMVLGLNTLRERVGVTSPLKKFRQLLLQITERDDLPAYRVFFFESDAKVPLTRMKVGLAPRHAESSMMPTRMIPSETDGI